MKLKEWSMEGVEFSNCNCIWGCPCQFNGAPTHGNCRAYTFVQIDRGRFDGVPLDGLRWGILAAWPGPIHLGNGTFQSVVDELFLDRALVHARRVVIANLLLDGAVLSGRLCLVEEVAQDVEIVLVQLVEATPSCLVCRNGIVLHPIAARILVEIRAGIDSLVDGRQIEVGNLLGKLRGRSSRRRCLSHGKYGSQQQWENGKRADLHVCLAYELALPSKPVSLRGALTKDRANASCGNGEGLHRKHYYNGY